MSEHTLRLRQAANEIRSQNLPGWGNTCSDAADRIEELERGKESALAYLELLGVTRERCKSMVDVGIGVLDSRLGKERLIEHVKNGRIEELEAENRKLLRKGAAVLGTSLETSAENTRLRRGLDNLKIRAYELGQRELHDQACKALEGKAGD